VTVAPAKATCCAGQGSPHEFCVAALTRFLASQLFESVQNRIFCPRQGVVKATFLAAGQGGRWRWRMKNSFGYFNGTPEVIRLTAMLYIRHSPSLRQVEDILFARGIDILRTSPRRLLSADKFPDDAYELGRLLHFGHVSALGDRHEARTGDHAVVESAAIEWRDRIVGTPDD
jgi:hypothetical protein